MKTLSIPEVGKKAEEVFEECARDFTTKIEYTRIALTYLTHVKLCSDEYSGYVPRNIGLLSHPQVDKLKEDDVEIIKKLYTDKFSKKDTVGYKYYKLIRLNANGVCPICGRGAPKTLDHFLPKSEYPLLCVTPCNLVPICRDCNTEKKDITSIDYFGLPFHPYFDVMDNQWIECTIDFIDARSFSVEFFNGYDKTKDINMWRKYNVHIEAYGIADTFASCAIEEINNMKKNYYDLLKECGEASVKDELIKVTRSAEAVDVNSWKSALYRGLSKQCHEFCIWLNKLP